MMVAIILVISFCFYKKRLENAAKNRKESKKRADRKKKYVVEDNVSDVQGESGHQRVSLELIDIAVGQ